MACFIVPAAEAIVATAAYAAVKNHEKKLSLPKLAQSNANAAEEKKVQSLTWSKKLSWLLALLWGGVLLLAFEHFWHGEIQPFAPFLTAMATPEDTSQMVHEMSTVGVSMAVCVTAVWGAICAFADYKARQIKKELKKAEA